MRENTPPRVTTPQAKRAANFHKIQPVASCSNCQYRNEDTDVCQGNPAVPWFKLRSPMTSVCDHWRLL